MKLATALSALLRGRKRPGLSLFSDHSSGTWTWIGWAPVFPPGQSLPGVQCLVNRQGQGFAEG